MSVRLVLIGCGDIVNRYYSSALKALAQEGIVELAACCDMEESKAKDICERTGFNSYDTDWKRVVGEQKPDAILTAVPVEKTTDLVMEIAPLNIPVMLEKPPALTVEKAILLNQTLKEHQILHQVAYNRHFMPLTVALKKKLESEARVQAIHIQMCRIKRLEPTFYTTAIHCIDLLRFLAGSEYTKVDFKYQELKEYGENIGNYFLYAEFANGISGRIDILVDSGQTCEHVQATCSGSTYMAYLPVWECADSPGRIEKYQGDRLIECEKGIYGQDALGNSMASGFYGEIRNFVQAVEAGIQPMENMDFSIPLIEIAQKLHLREKEYRRDG